MATSDADLWHQVHAQREDGVSAMFLIRDVEPRPDQPHIFVIEMPYVVTDISRLPDAAGYRRLDAFQQQWIDPACKTLGWTFVAWKSEDGSFFLYLYGGGDPNALLEKLSPFDGSLGFFNDRDDDWSEYAALRELVDQAQAVPDDDEDDDEDGSANDHVHTEDCNHTYDPDATSDGIPVLDLTGERLARKRAARADTVNMRALAADGSAEFAAPTDAFQDEEEEEEEQAEAEPEPAPPAKRRAKASPAKRSPPKPTPAPAKASPAKRASPRATPARAKAAKAAVTTKPARKATATRVATSSASAKRTGKQPSAGPAARAATAGKKPTTTSKPATTRATASKPSATKPTASKATARRPASSKATASKSAASKSTAGKSTASKPVASKATASKPTAKAPPPHRKSGR